MSDTLQATKPAGPETAANATAAGPTSSGGSGGSGSGRATNGVLLPLAAGNRAVSRFVQREGPKAPTPPPSSAPATPDEIKFFESPIENLIGMIGKKRSVKGTYTLPLKGKTIAKDYIVVESVSVTGEVGMEVARSGNTTVLSLAQGAAGSASREGRRSELGSKGKTIGTELKTTQDGFLTRISEGIGAGKISGSATEIKWVGLEGLMDKEGKAKEVAIGGEITEKLEIPLGAGWFFQPAVSISLSVASVDTEKNEVKVGAGAVNIAGETGKKESLSPMDIGGLRTPKYDKTFSAKVTGSLNVRVNEKKVALKLLEKVGMMAAKKALPQVAKGLGFLTGVPAKMIVAGILTVCNGIDAYIEGDRQKHLGEMASSLPYVFAGGFLSSFKKMAVGAPATALGPVAAFLGAGATSGKEARAKAIADMKATPEAKNAKDDEIEAAVDEAIKSKPVFGMATVAQEARKPVDDYVLKKFIDGRTNMATDIFDFFGNTDHKIDPNNPDASPEYRKFRDHILKAYTTTTNDPYFNDTALKNAMKEAEKQGIKPDQLETWLANYMMGKAQGTIDEAEPETRMDELEEKKKTVDDLLSGWVSDDDIRAAARVALSMGKNEGRDQLLAICRKYKSSLNERQAKLLSDLSGA